MYIKLFENTGARTPGINGQFFLSVYSNNYPLSNSFQVVTAINPRLKTTADGETAQFLKVSTKCKANLLQTNKLQYKQHSDICKVLILLIGILVDITFT